MTSHDRQEGAILKRAVNLALEDEQAADLIRRLAACPPCGAVQTRQTFESGAVKVGARAPTAQGDCCLPRKG